MVEVKARVGGVGEEEEGGGEEEEEGGGEVTVTVPLPQVEGDDAGGKEGEEENVCKELPGPGARYLVKGYAVAEEPHLRNDGGGEDP